MILNIYVMRDRVVGAYNRPFYDNLDRDDFVENLRRTILHGKLDPSLKDQELYFLGTFNDKNSHFDLIEPDFIVSLDQFFPNDKEVANG